MCPSLNRCLSKLYRFATVTKVVVSCRFAPIGEVFNITAVAFLTGEELKILFGLIDFFHTAATLACQLSKKQDFQDEGFASYTCNL